MTQQQTRSVLPLTLYAHHFSNQLHYFADTFAGIIETGENARHVGLLTSQQRLINWVTIQLPPPPQQVLLFGIGSGVLAMQLVGLGYQVSVYIENIDATTEALNSFAKKLTLLTELPPTACYDVAMIIESQHSIAPLAFFNQLYKLLNQQASVYQLSSVSLKRYHDDEFERLPLLDTYKKQIARCGFQVNEPVMLTDYITESLDDFVKNMSRQKLYLCERLHLSARNFTRLVIELEQQRQRYHDGRYGYAFLHFEKTKLPRWHTSEVTEQDQAAVSGLFAQVFKHPLSKKVWQWKYAGEHGMGTAAWRDGQLVAHYGGMVRRILYFGQPEKAAQICDVMVEEKERGVLTRKGAFFLSGASFPECYLGHGNDVLLGFGFPTYHHQRIAELLNLYTEVGRMVEITWQPLTGKPKLLSRIRHINPDNKHDQSIVNQLWRHMKAELTDHIVGIRDWKQVKYRYFDHPENNYDVLLITRRFTRQPLGVIVLRREENFYKLLDIIAPTKHIPIILEQTRRIVAQWGGEKVVLWITNNYANLLHELGEAEVKELDVCIPHCTWYKGQGPDVEEVKDKWLLLGGDTDFM